ncbi:MAG: SdrD B-like domain-containing protein [Kiritimatiellia bacterium]
MTMSQWWSVWDRPAPGVMNNDSDLNGFDIAVVAHTQPAHGTLVLNADGSYTYTPEPDYYGSDSFTYTITNFNGRADTATVYLTVLPVNDAPGFTGGADQNLTVGAGAQTVPAWATNISKGPANESGQTLTFHVTNNNAALFSVPPSISADGTLTYTPAPNMSGIATVTVYLQDDGGRANGGEDRSAEYTFTINVAGYSIGNRVFKDLNNDGVHDFADSGIAGVRMALFAEADGQPVGSALQTTVTDAEGFYRFDHLAAGTYVVVADVAESPSLAGFVSSTGHYSSLALDGDLRDHGIDTPVSVGGITNGIASVPVTVGDGQQPLSELVNVNLDAGRRGPCGDAYDNLVVDFGFTPLYSIGNRVFADDNYNGYRDDNEGGIAGVPIYAFAAGADGLPTGEPLAYAVTDADGWYRLDGLVIGTYVSVLVPRMGSKLVGVPNTDDERRNRAVDAGEDAVIVHTVLSGAGVLDGRPSETLNFGFENHPLSTAIDIRLYATPDGVMIQLWTVNEAGCGDIVIYAWIDNAWGEVGRVPAWLVVGEGANDYTVAANGLAAGGAYYLKVIDEVGNVHLSLTPVAVDALQVDAVKLDLQYVTLRFNTESGRSYQVEVSTDLVTWRTEYVSAPTAKGWTAFTTEPFMAGADTHTEVRVPRNGRARAFFKIKCVER